jgi:hypothetical protein
MSETKFHTHTEPQASRGYAIYIFLVFQWYQLNAR